MEQKKKQARWAGILYLIMAITGGFGIMYIPESILVSGNAQQTSDNIINSGWMYNFSILSSLTCQVIFLFLVLAFHKLFKEVNPYLSKIMVVLVVASVPIAMLNTLNLVGAEWLVNAPETLTAFSVEQLNGLALFFVEMNEKGIILVEIFWGLWLLPLGLLVMKSGFVPRIIGVLLLIGGIFYMFASIIGLSSPDLHQVVAPYLTIPLAVGEFSMIFWLLIKGVKSPTKN